MAGTPMLAVFNVDVTKPAVKAFGKRVAASAKLQGGPKFHVYSPPKGGGDGLEGKVLYVWFPDGPEGADVLLQGRDPDAAAALIKAAKDAGITTHTLNMGKQRMHRIAEHNRDATNPPAALVLYGVKVDKNRKSGNTQNLKAGLKTLHQQVISKNQAVRYAAHKLGDGEHGFLVAALDSVNALKGTSAPIRADDPAADDVLVAQLKDKLSNVVPKNASYKTVLKYNPEFSNS
jgi:hypothetical protein